MLYVKILGCGELLGPSIDAPGAWHSQGGQDRIVSSVFEGQRGGYFVDLAAASPVVLSNSRTLERDFAWRGLCIEGNHRLIASLMRERKCSVVHTLISSHAANVTFTENKLGQQGFNHISSRRGAAGGANVHSALPLEAVLRSNGAPAVMEYLSLDVENHERAVLEHFPFGSYRWHALSIETVEPALAATLARHGYVHALDVYHPLPDGRRKLLDHFYLHEAIPGGVDAARKRARASKRLWDDAMARRLWSAGWSTEPRADRGGGHRRGHRRSESSGVHCRCNRLFTFS